MDTTNLRLIIVDAEPAHAEAIRRAFEAAGIAVEIIRDKNGLAMFSIPNGYKVIC